MKKAYTITVKGKYKKWCFPIMLEPEYIDEWRADGLEIDEAGINIPVWVVDAGLARPYFVLCDLFAFRLRDAWRTLTMRG